jgi:hypothetical protein
MSIRIFLAAAALFLAPLLRAANYSNEVLAIGVGARALGMGGAYTGIAEDSTAVYWNPAGLPKVSHVEISAIQQGRQYSGTGLNEVGSRYLFASGAMNFGGLGSFGAAFMRFSVDDIPYVTGIDPVSGAPVQDGTFQTQDFGVLLSWGKTWHKALNAGLSFKYLSGGTVGLKGSLGDAGYSYMGADIGVLLDFGGMSPSLKGLSLGLNLQDALNTGVAWKNTPTNPTDPVDMNPKVGLAYSVQAAFLRDSGSAVNFAFDADPKYGSNTLLHYGGEFWYKDTLAFRAGLRQFLGGLQDLEATVGASFKLSILQVDYAFINYELTPIHYLSLAIKF